jgi:hypothetical protein
MGPGSVEKQEGWSELLWRGRAVLSIVVQCICPSGVEAAGRVADIHLEMSHASNIEMSGLYLALYRDSWQVRRVHTGPHGNEFQACRILGEILMQV